MDAREVEILLNRPKRKDNDYVMVLACAIRLQICVSLFLCLVKNEGRTVCP